MRKRKKTVEIPLGPLTIAVPETINPQKVFPKCPKCKVKMARIHDKRISNSPFFRCPQCGKTRDMRG